MGGNVADGSRLAAFENWTKCFHALNDALNAFNDACEDPRFIQPTSVLSGPDAESFPFESLCLKFEGYIPQLDSLRSSFKHACMLIGRLRNYSSSLVSIHRLPSELLSAIFLHSIGDEALALSSVQDTYTRPHGIPTVPRVAQVCHMWRAVSIDTAELWTWHDTRLIMSREDLVDEWLRKSKLWADRSRGPNLDMILCRSEYEPSLEQLFTEYTRWRSLRLITPSNEFFEHLRACPMQIGVRCLTLQWLDETWDTFGLLISKFPSVTTLRISSDTDPGSWTPTIFLNVTVLELHLEETKMEGVINKCLRNCPSLQELTLYVVNYNVTETEPNVLNPAPITLPDLQFLYLKAIPVSTGKLFWSTVQMPVLQDLRISYHTMDALTSLPDSIKMTLSVTLNQLTIHSWMNGLLNSNRNQILSFLENLKNLEELVVSCCSAPDWLFQGLDPSCTPRLCPLLKRIKFHATRVPPFELAQLIARSLHTSPLIEFSILECSVWIVTEEDRDITQELLDSLPSRYGLNMDYLTWDVKV
jgi:hypothetical protein